MKTRYQTQLRKLLDDNILDIIIFGSMVKGGLPKDIDLAVVVRDKVQDIRGKIRNIIENADINLITLDSIYSSIWLTLIKEGYSIKKGKYIHEIYKITPVILFKFSLKGLSAVQKVQFNRGMKGVVKDKGNYLTRSVVLIPIAIRNEMIEFLKHWDVYYECQEYELLPVMRKDVFI